MAAISVKSFPITCMGITCSLEVVSFLGISVGRGVLEASGVLDIAFHLSL